jgi:hypothetical protein
MPFCKSFGNFLFPQKYFQFFSIILRAQYENLKKHERICEIAETKICIRFGEQSRKNDKCIN